MSDHPFVSRAGLKLQHALDVFEMDVTGFRCADLGCNVGGFTDCLLQQGAASVHAVDTAYGELAWSLRNDDRVHVMERTNALHLDPTDEVDLVTVDLGWTPQHRAIPAALGWSPAWIITLVKPHYELGASDRGSKDVGSGISEDALEGVLANVRDMLVEYPVDIVAETRSPIRGKKSSRQGGGNPEHLMLLRTTSEGLPEAR